MRIPSGRKPILGTSDDIVPMVRWLLIVSLMILAIVVIGGITRLTESGVSIVEWKPITGALPPLTQSQWQAEFAAYQQTPQYTQINGPAGMTLATYKFIYFWEWLHRLLARVIGLAFAAPLAWFWLKGTIPGGYKPRLLALLALGGLQGAVGWWMVSSGIVNDVKVSHFRLAAHLLVALTTLGGLVWTALDLLALKRGEPRARLSGLGIAALAMVAVQLLFGALLAGLRAGVVAGAGWGNWGAWPLMQGRVFPEGVEPALVPFSDPYFVHFFHRWWAWATLAVLVVLSRRIRDTHRSISVAIHAAIGIQILLGIFTIWSGVTLWIAVAHQLVGALVLSATVWGANALGRKATITRL